MLNISRLCNDETDRLDFEISPGYRSTGFLENDKPAIPGTGGRILAVWCVSAPGRLYSPF